MPVAASVLRMQFTNRVQIAFTTARSFYLRWTHDWYLFFHRVGANVSRHLCSAYSTVAVGLIYDYCRLLCQPTLITHLMYSKSRLALIYLLVRNRQLVIVSCFKALIYLFTALIMLKFSTHMTRALLEKQDDMEVLITGPACVLYACEVTRPVFVNAKRED